MSSLTKTHNIDMETTKEEFKKLSGIDLTDHEHSGVFPYYKNGKWSSISRGEAWQMYAKWLEDKSTSQKETIERFLKWHKTEDEKPEEGKQYLVYDEINGICFDCWVKLYEEPVPGMGRICIGEGWEETEIEGSYWMEIPNYPEAEQLLKETEQ